MKACLYLRLTCTDGMTGQEIGLSRWMTPHFMQNSQQIEQLKISWKWRRVSRVSEMCIFLLFCQTCHTCGLLSLKHADTKWDECSGVHTEEMNEQVVLYVLPTQSGGGLSVNLAPQLFYECTDLDWHHNLCPLTGISGCVLSVSLSGGATVPSTAARQTLIRDLDDLIGPPFLVITLSMKNGLSILAKWVFLCLTKPNDTERCM